MKSRGFTLIELLAVIVILAIIALIATPMILGIIEKSKQGAAKASALGYIDAVEKYIVMQEIKGYPVKLENNTTYKVTKDSNYEIGLLDIIIEKVSAEGLSEEIILNDIIDVKGELPKNGYVKIGYKKVEDALLVFDEYNADLVDGDFIIRKGTSEEEIEVPKVLHKEAKLNGADPVLKGSLIPVVIENDGTVKKADLYSNWYSYENQRWANAVILKDETVTYEDNVVIPEENIESYFVWIPRYRYKIFNEGNYTSAGTTKPTTSSAQEIEIEFESKEVTPSTGSTKDSWLTHPAFTTFDVNGMWVAKFKTGYDGATSVTEAEVNSNDSSKVIVKPNVYSWRGITVYNIFTSLYNYKRELDSHMMKNTEWGAVAYLSHSKYGINSNISINNNSQYMTGYGATPTTDQSSYPGTSGTDSSVTQPWNTEVGYKASTTGNITGIYDMTGGAYDYLAAYKAQSLGSSGFTETSIAAYDSKYFDVYNANSAGVTYNYRILGDATGELGPFNYYGHNGANHRNHNNWYEDDANFLSADWSWFNRGGHFSNGVAAGIFNFTVGKGMAYNFVGSRLVLSFN